MSSQSESYEPQDAIGKTVPAVLIAGTTGLFASAVQNTLTKENVGPMGVFTRTGGNIATFAGVVGTFQFTSVAAANLRQKDDFINDAIGGFLGGAVLGLRARTMPAVVGYAIAVSVGMGAFNYTGGLLQGYQSRSETDDFERREELKKRGRRPIQETINEIGEGRGIYGPGYAERRKERIKEAYGIDVPAHPWYKSTS